MFVSQIAKDWYVKQTKRDIKTLVKQSTKFTLNMIFLLRLASSNRRKLCLDQWFKWHTETVQIMWWWFPLFNFPICLYFVLYMLPHGPFWIWLPSGCPWSSLAQCTLSLRQRWWRMWLKWIIQEQMPTQFVILKMFTCRHPQIFLKPWARHQMI